MGTTFIIVHCRNNRFTSLQYTIEHYLARLVGRPSTGLSSDDVRLADVEEVLQAGEAFLAVAERHDTSIKQGAL